MIGNIGCQCDKDKKIPMKSKNSIEKYSHNQIIQWINSGNGGISNYDSGLSIVTKEDEWNIVEERRVDSQTNKHKNVVMESKVVLMIFRVPIENKTPIT